MIADHDHPSIQQASQKIPPIALVLILWRKGRWGKKIMHTSRPSVPHDDNYCHPRRLVTSYTKNMIATPAPPPSPSLPHPLRWSTHLVRSDSLFFQRYGTISTMKILLHDVHDDKTRGAWEIIAKVRRYHRHHTHANITCYLQHQKR